MAPNHPHGGHRSRLRARFEKSPKTLEDHELLELLLFYGIPQKDTNTLAHNLLRKFDSLSGVVDAQYGQLKSVPGLGDTSALLLPVVQEIIRRYFWEKTRREPPEAYDSGYLGFQASPLFVGQYTENVYALALRRDFSVKDYVCIGTGGVNSAPINLKVLYSFVESVGNCYIAVAHNHPSGVGLPSPQDYFATDRIRMFIEDAGGHFLDHLIFDVTGDFVSLRESGQLYRANRKLYMVTAKDYSKETDYTKFYTKVSDVSEDVTKNQTNDDTP